MPRPTYKQPESSYSPGAGILQEEKQPSARAGGLIFTGESSSLLHIEESTIRVDCSVQGLGRWGAGSAGLAHPELS